MSLFESFSSSVLLEIQTPVVKQIVQYYPAREYPYYEPEAREFLLDMAVE